jgi:hypothetical protein
MEKVPAQSVAQALAGDETILDHHRIVRASAEARPYSKYVDEKQKQALAGYCVFEELYPGSFVLISRDSVADAPQLFLLEYPYRLTRLRLSSGTWSGTRCSWRSARVASTSSTTSMEASCPWPRASTKEFEEKVKHLG